MQRVFWRAEKLARGRIQVDDAAVAVQHHDRIVHLLDQAITGNRQDTQQMIAR